MSVEYEGIPLTWEEIKAASPKLQGRSQAQELQEERRMVREYLEHEECDDARAEDHIAIPGYN